MLVLPSPLLSSCPSPGEGDDGVFQPVGVAGPLNAW